MSPPRRARDHEPKPLRDALAEVSHDLGMPAPDALAEVLDAWPTVVGTALAPHARVRSLRDGELTVEVEAPTFATELRFRSEELTAGLAEHLGRRVVERLRIVVAGRAAGP